MLNIGRGTLFCLCFVFVIKSAASFWDFWPFNRNSIKTPSVKIHPKAEGNFFYFNHSDEANTLRHIESAHKFLSAYDETNDVHNIYQCDFNNTPPENGICTFNVKNFGSCSMQNNFGYHKSSPCFFFTLSQMEGAGLDTSRLKSKRAKQHSDAFLNVPDYLNATLAVNEIENPSEEYIWFTCDGDTAADKEYIGTVNYYPRNNGFPFYYFPFRNLKGYQSPIVAVHFERPTRGVVINVVCKAWAKNIQLNKENGTGFVTFQFLID